MENESYEAAIRPGAIWHWVGWKAVWLTLASNDGRLLLVQLTESHEQNCFEPFESKANFKEFLRTMSHDLVIVCG